MQKQAPSVGRILVAVGFALSCFGLMLFLWVSFGGPVPLKPRSYEVSAYFPEATSLGPQTDVRIGGVSVGRVTDTELAPPDVRIDGRDTTKAVLEIEPEFAPISSDARAILRQKTLLGEPYVELTAGTEPATGSAQISLGEYATATSSDAAAAAQPIPEGGSLGTGQVQQATQFDEILNAFDARERTRVRHLLSSSAGALEGRSMDLSDALGNLGPLFADAAQITSRVRSQRGYVHRLIRDGGLVLESVRADDHELSGAITGTEQTFGGLADSKDALASTVSILPVFEREATATLRRLDELGAHARPVVRKLVPVARDVSPTLRSVRVLAPELRSLFVKLGPLLDAAKDGLPALRDTLRELGPAIDALDPFLANLNPVLSYLHAYRNMVISFFTNPNIGISGTLPQVPGQPTPRHALRILAYLSAESLAVHHVRLDTNRGNAYVPPTVTPLEGSPSGYAQEISSGIFPNFDCKNTDYTQTSQPPDEDEHRYKDGGTPQVGYDYAGCIITNGFGSDLGGGRAPNVFEEP
jgi:phospholipid/cholesterol/gamma-HCH transport system substrate-binding protein